MKQKIFISKNEDELKDLIVCLPEFDVIGHSFLSFEAVDFDISSNYDAVFFGSPRAVNFFLEKTILDHQIKIACVGKKTAEALENKGYHASFIVEKSGNIDVPHDEFLSWVGEKKILFPQSDRSLKSFSSLIRGKQKTEIVIYKTILSSCPIEKCDYYAFTSPSNVSAFFQENVIYPTSKIIAWGDSTAKAIMDHQLNPTYILTTSSIEELIDLLHKELSL